MVNHFHCVWIDERFQNALRCLLADHVFVRRPSIVQEFGRSGSGLFFVRLYQERLCIGSRSPMPVYRYNVRGVMAHRAALAIVGSAPKHLQCLLSIFGAELQRARFN